MFNDSMVVAEGYGSGEIVVSGNVMKLDKSFSLSNVIDQSLFRKILFVDYSISLYECSLILNLNPIGIIITKGNVNYHPLIFFKDVLLPCISGIGDNVTIPGYVTMDCSNGRIYREKKHINKEISIDSVIADKVYANIGSKEAVQKSFELGALGIGIFRTEFTAVRFLSNIINNNISEDITVRDYINQTNEADAIYHLIKIPFYRNLLKETFKEVIDFALKFYSEKAIIIRSIDLERQDDDTLGYRGIRRCLAEGGGVLKIIIEAIKEILQDHKTSNLALIFPLVSSYHQIFQATHLMLSSGLNIHDNTSRNFVKVGWKIEQPVSVINCKYWLEAFKNDFNLYPHYLGIGSNDLTQFTMSIGRNINLPLDNIDSKNYIDSLYDEGDFSIIKMLFDVSAAVDNKDVEVIIHGELGAKKEYAELLKFLNINVSVSTSKIQEASVIRKSLDFQHLNKDKIIAKILKNLPFSESIRLIMKNDLLEIIKDGNINS